ncbi:hypothetical protein FVE85_9541 [Porphyridium purpureum]|uniref:Integrase catalytic domain-containing protein n=1 Tax=Porphyridium purpureum TaxID=35688 RepID=A0A5J4YIE1_PORPP|nr:hypothetical protein FVE85_9541 [Porphyridium purpureum]|eukprot:POR6886..scf261_15
MYKLIEPLRAKDAASLGVAMEKIRASTNSCGIDVVELRSDREKASEALMSDLGEARVAVEFTAGDEAVPVAERANRQVKERVRVLIYKVLSAVPKTTLTGVVKYARHTINTMPTRASDAKDEISQAVYFGRKPNVRRDLPALLNLNSVQTIVRQRWMPLPMPDRVIANRYGMHRVSGTDEELLSRAEDNGDIGERMTRGDD